MKRLILTAATVALLVPLGGALSPAEAGGRWHGAASFKVGGFHFSLGYHAPYGRYYRGYPYRPAYYYRVARPFAYRGPKCGAACYRHDRYHYHHPRCPVVSYHFRRHGYWPGKAWSQVGPYGYPGQGGYGYRPPWR